VSILATYIQRERERKRDAEEQAKGFKNAVSSQPFNKRILNTVFRTPREIPEILFMCRGPVLLGSVCGFVWKQFHTKLEREY
jgi:hypothetical protein